MEKVTVLKLSDEENEILKKAFKIIDELTDEANSDYNWASEKLLYHIGSYLDVNGKDMKKCYEIFQELKEEKEITFSIKED